MAWHFDRWSCFTRTRSKSRKWSIDIQMEYLNRIDSLSLIVCYQQVRKLSTDKWHTRIYISLYGRREREKKKRIYIYCREISFGHDRRLFCEERVVIVARVAERRGRVDSSTALDDVDLPGYWPYNENTGPINVPFRLDMSRKRDRTPWTPKHTHTCTNSPITCTYWKEKK